jgi:biotin-dependent enzyme
VDPVFVKGVVAFLIFMVLFVGSVWLLLSFVVGGRLAYYITGATFFGLMAIMSLIWVGLLPPDPQAKFFKTALGPKGVETTWFGLGVGKQLSKVDLEVVPGAEKSMFDVSDYPDGKWTPPRKGGHLADLSGDSDTEKEVSNAKPVMETLVNTAISAIPGKRDSVTGITYSEVGLKSGSYAVTDLLMREDSVDGKPSIVAVGRAVPADTIKAATLGAGIDSGSVSKHLVNVGDRVSAGEPIIEVATSSGAVQVPSSTSGRVIAYGLQKGDTVKPGVPFATIDLTGQPGQPDPVEVAAARVRGNVQIPALYYLIASTVLFLLHMLGLSRTERRLKAMRPVTA